MKFKIAESKGRITFAELCSQLKLDITFTDNQFDRMDFIMRTDNTFKTKYQSIGGEIKNRNPQDIKYSTHLLSVDKIINLLKYNPNAGLYVLIFGDDLFIYNVRKIYQLVKDNILKIETKYLPKSTILNKGYKDYKVILVPKKYGMHFKRINGIWLSL